jgi:peptidoglycan/LPS O-acetylase OafA/YrhL
MRFTTQRIFMPNARDSNQDLVIPHRKDIDGLRAVSIIGVILFHAFPGLLTGGFIGVDVFFIISGFLISSIIIKNLESANFSLIDFYCKRIIRIFPALLTVLIAVYATGWHTLYAKEFEQVGKHIAAGAGFVQNFALLSESGYFDTATESKPLMHLWSLAIEEQFYLIYPLLLALSWQMGRRFLLIIAGTLLLSFVSNIYFTHTQPSQAFYYPHTRFWELLLGALLCLLLGKAQAIPAYIKQAISVLGIFLIIAGYSFIDSDKAFPGWWALAPTVGASLIIFAGPNTWMNQRVLSHGVMQFIGRISYPLYLWHWPLLVFPAILYGGQLSAASRILMIVVCFGLSWATYAWIERPIRFSLTDRLRGKSLMLLTGVILIGFVGYNTYHRAGLSFRNINKINIIPQTAFLRGSQHLTAPECAIAAEQRHLFGFCHQDKIKKIRYVVWGDSKGEAIFWGLIQKQNAQHGWRMIGDPGCIPMSGARRMTPVLQPNDPEKCAQGNAAALHALIKDSDIHTVLIGAGLRVFRDYSYTDESGKLDSTHAAWHGLSVAIGALENAGKKIIFVMDNPTLPEPSKCLPPRITQSDLVNRLLARPLDVRCTISYDQHLKDTQAYRDQVSELQAHHPAMIVYSPDHLLCDLSQGTCPVLKNGRFLYSYTDHLSDYGSGLIADEIMSLVESDNLPAGAP